MSAALFPVKQPVYFRTEFEAARVNFTVVRIFLTFFILLSCCTLQAQENVTDTIVQEDVVVKGFETNRTLRSTAAPVFSFSAKEIGKQVFPGATFAPLLNRVPGVRMEERSPGSYRLSIRGSLLRSPFGIRNIKVYLAGLPFTDAGGNTYINLLDVNMMHRMEILKGPSGITYGAGTGGTLLLNEPGEQRQPGEKFSASISGGSYGTFGEHVNYSKSNKGSGFSIQQSHAQSDGYRENSFLRRDAVMLQGALKNNEKDFWNLLLLYGNLHYETPGGITFEQMMANPKLSRQRSGGLPSAIEQQAGIYQQTIFTGLSGKHTFNERWEAKSAVFYAYTGFANPFITNYETRFENSTGVRLVFNYTDPSKCFRLNTGGEAALTHSLVTNYGNRGGKKDTLQNKDRVNAQQAFAFIQAQWPITSSLIADAGISANHFSFDYHRLHPLTAEGRRSFNIQLLPRVSLLYQFNRRASVYASISRGYSPPTIAEVRPDNQALNTTLQPEAGTNMEMGVRGNLLPFILPKLYVDISAYRFSLNHTIVRRTSAAGDFFVNAGNTKQKGIEFLASYLLVSNSTIEELKLFTSATLNHYRFNKYRIGNAVYDGNRITGVSGKIYVWGADLSLTKGWYMNATATYTSSLPLTDDNSVTAESFYLLNGRTGYRFSKKKYSLDVFIAGNNLLNELYSPGNDLNALGRRYYNPGARRNFMAGVMLKM